MVISSVKRYSFALTAAIIVAANLISGCQNNMFDAAPPAQLRLQDMPAVRLNFRYEADVPAPALNDATGHSEERNAGVQTDFDTNRPLELLDRTLTAPDKKHVVAIYHRLSDIPSEFRLDMYAADGKPLRKLTSDNMAAHFPETITWSPDSASLAFVGILRINPMDTGGVPPATPTTVPTAETDIAANAEAANSVTDQTATPQPAATPIAPTGILTFRTEQIYICGADGSGIKPVTVSEGLIYFYYAWSPDSSMLVSLAATAREWRYLDVISNSKNEILVPQGRLRIVETNGRERRLDDNLTAVRPVWSPDSTKVAAAFENQVRIYDASGISPTQSAIPLRNQLLISSQAYDRDQQRKLQAGNTEGAVPEASPAEQPLSMLPDEKLLVSYNPIVEIAWTSDDLLYLQTAYLKRMRNEADSVRSFSRWHRLVLSPQPPAAIKQ